MSGLVKGVKKVFKKAVKFVKKYWKAIAIAVAVYFTAGVALSYFGSTAGFATTYMPGFQAGGMFSKAAVAMGFNGAAGVTSGIGLTAAAASAVPATLANTSGVLLAGKGLPAAGAGVGAVTSGTTTATMAGATVAPTAFEAGLLKSMSVANKLAVAQTVMSIGGGLFEEKQSTINRKQIEAQNNQSFGVGRDGSQEFGWASSSPPPSFNMNQRTGGGSQFAKVDSDFLASPYQTPATQMQPSSGQDFIQSGYKKGGNYTPEAMPS